MLHQLNVADGEDVAPPAKFMPPNGKPYALNLVNNVHLHAHGARLRRQSEHGLYLRSRDEESGHLGSGGRRHVGPHRPGDQPDGDDVHRHRRRPLGSGERHLRQRHHRREAEPGDQGAGTGGLLRSVQRRVAGEARSRHAGDARDLQLQGQGTDGRRRQGMPPVPDGYQVDRRRRPSHAALPQPADLQRRRQLRVGRHLGIARRPGRIRKARAGC